MPQVSNMVNLNQVVYMQNKDEGQLRYIKTFHEVPHFHEIFSHSDDFGKR